MLYIIIGAVELGLIYSLMSLGLFMSYRVLNVADLTVDGSFTTGAAVSVMITATGHPMLGLLCAIPAGAAAGLITSLLQTKLRIQPILSGILTMTFLYSANLWIMGGKSNISLLGKNTLFSGIKGLLPESMRTFEKLLVILPVVLIVCLLLVFFLRTKTGLSVRATGDNVDMVRASSINPHATNAIALCIANALVALSGGLLAQYQQSADISMGIGMVVIGLASVIIGEVIFGSSSIHRHITAVIIGSVLYRCFIAMALRAASSNDLKAISAVIVTIAISYPTIKEILAVRKLKKEARNG